MSMLIYVRTYCMLCFACGCRVIHRLFYRIPVWADGRGDWDQRRGRMGARGSGGRGSYGATQRFVLPFWTVVALSPTTGEMTSGTSTHFCVMYG